MAHKRWLVILMLPLMGACYRYTPAAMSDLSAGDDIRARITAVQFDEMDEFLPTDNRLLQGTVVEAASDGLLLEVPVNQTLQGMTFQSLSQRFEIPESGILEVELRELDRGKTFGITALATAVIGLVVWDQLLSDAGQSADRPGPPPDEDRITIRIPWSSIW